MKVSRRFVLGAPFLLGACQPLPPMPEEPIVAVSLESAFAGRAGGSGVFLRKHVWTEERFTLAQSGRRLPDRLMVEQTFTFETGTRNHLVWHFFPQQPGLWRGQRDDLVGTARVVENSGMVWFSYQADFVRPGGTVRWGFEEMLYRRQDGALVIDGVLAEGGTPALNERIILRT
ncbi:MAG: DUF3833 family protein [Pararhodobacter sp.]